MSSRARTRSVSTSLGRLLWLDLPVATNQVPHRVSVAGMLLAQDELLEYLVNMVRMPLNIERFMSFGLLLCLNLFLFFFTGLPVRLLLSSNQLVGLVSQHVMGRGSGACFADLLLLLFANSVKNDYVTVALVGCSLRALRSLDLSRIYHGIRGEAAIKLYVVVGVLEVADKLCTLLGQDLLSILYRIQVPLELWGVQGQQRLSRKDRLRLQAVHSAKFAVFFVGLVGYIAAHAWLLIYQAIALSVAVNSFLNALLGLLLLNQFAELKLTVFKKFERELLFQATVADLVERFQLCIMLLVVVLRNLFQLRSSSGDGGIIPNLWLLAAAPSLLLVRWMSLLTPMLTVLGLEVLVDWIKHLYITKFNRLRPRLYTRFLHVISRDFVHSVQGGTVLEPHLVVYLNKRLGLPLMALLVCFLRMTAPLVRQPWEFHRQQGTVVQLLAVVAVAYLLVACFRTILTMGLLKWAAALDRQSRASRPARERSSSRVPHTVVEHSKEQGAVERDVVEMDGPELSTPYKGLPHISSGLGLPRAATSPVDRSDILLDFAPGVPNTLLLEIEPTLRLHLYDDRVPPDGGEARVRKVHRELARTSDDLEDVERYQMVGKQIW